jgi:MFS transporter, FHS family, glucose/mannose:H+ symporter
VASSTLWGLALLAIFLTGLGYGGANIGFNTLFSRGFGTRSASMTNLLHAVFGIGSIGGPLLVGALRGDFRGPFWIGAVCGVALLGLSLNLRRTSSDNASGEMVTEALTESSSGGFRVTPGLLLFTLLFLVYVVVEVGASSAEPRHLSDALGFTPQNAAFINSLFWGGLTVGRLVGASLGLRVAAPHLVLGAAGLVMVSLLLTHLSGFAPMAYTLAGLACGPIFPTALVWLTRVVPGGAAATSVVVAAASGGGIIATQAVNLIARDASAIPGALSLYAALLVAVVIALRWQTVGYPTAKP